MTQEKKEIPRDRQKRVKRLKRMIIGGLFFLIMLPIGMCIFLMIQVSGLNRQVADLTGRLNGMSAPYRQPAEIQTGPDATPEGDGQAKPPDGTLEELENGPYRKIYLTFDDGPSVNTGRILDILDAYEVKASFFVVGKEDEASKESIRRIAKDGHTLGMHSYTHKYTQLYESPENFAADFEKERAYLRELTGEDCRFYRFPGGSSNQVSRTDMDELIAYLDEQGVTYYDWNVDSGDADARRAAPESIVARCTQNFEDKRSVVILMHDAADKSTTVEALPQIIEKIQEMDNTVFLPITEYSTPVQHERHR